jgi:hypothetical protein
LDGAGVTFQFDYQGHNKKNPIRKAVVPVGSVEIRQDRIVAVAETVTPENVKCTFVSKSGTVHEVHM